MYKRQVVKREHFVPDAYRSLAFADIELPLGDGQKMLFPRVEARILQALGVKKHETVLEIGAGSGYMAALLAARGQHVISAEIDPKLAAFAAERLKQNAVTNAEVVLGDGLSGRPEQGPYDVICVSGGLPAVPQALLQQLKVGGRLAAFVGGRPVMEAQLITRVDDQQFSVADLFETYVDHLVNVIEPSRFKF